MPTTREEALADALAALDPSQSESFSRVARALYARTLDADERASVVAAVKAKIPNMPKTRLGVAHAIALVRELGRDAHPDNIANPVDEAELQPHRQELGAEVALLIQNMTEGDNNEKADYLSQLAIAIG